MSYLVVKNDTERKSYSLTDQWETKPYLKVKDGNNVEGILPLTTDIEYTTLTSTYISSSSNSEGMSNITYLTCESTSGTSYLTESIAANPYLSMHTLQRVTNAVSQTATTAQMPSYQSSVTYSKTNIQSWSNITKTSIYNSNTNFSTVRFSANASGSSSFIRSGTSQGSNINGTTTLSNVRSSTQLYLTNTTYSDVRYTTTSAKVGNSLRYSAIQTYRTNYNSNYIKGLSAYSYESVTIYFSGTSSVSTTGTSYLTRESTSGYSGELLSTYTSYPSIKLINKIDETSSHAELTSAINSEGLVSTTALTRESTSGTSYITDNTLYQLYQISSMSGTSWGDTYGRTFKSSTDVYAWDIISTSSSVSYYPGYNDKYITTLTMSYLKGTRSYSQAETGANSGGQSSYNKTTTSSFDYGTLTRTITVGHTENNGTGSWGRDGTFYISESLAYTEYYGGSMSTGKTSSVIKETAITETSYLTCESTSGYSGYSIIVDTVTQSYRANYWTSESGSFYTSAEQSEGMYDTTALTRESTSGTSYLTVSTSTLPYVDIIRIHNETLSTTQHATTAGMYDLTNINTTQSTNINRYYNVTSFRTSQSKSSATILYRCNNVATTRDISYTRKVSSNHSGYPGEQHITSSTIHTETGNQYANSSSNYTTHNWINGTSQYAGTWYTYTLVASSYMSGTNQVFVYGSLKNVRGGRNDPASATYYQTFEPYLTSTVYYPASSAESTTGTSYLTCESTSGYSGVSSTSSGTWI